MKIEILRADGEHIDIIAPLFDAYRVFYQQESNPSSAYAFIKARLEHAESVIFLALDANAGVGFTQLYPLFSSVALKRLWLLNDLYVTPVGRRLGVGKLLMERARQYAIETEAEGLELATAVDNFGAQRLYESLGYQRDTQFIHYYLHV